VAGVLYQNRTDSRIELGIGQTPGKPWHRFDSEPGQTIEGPGVPNYREVFERAGYTVVTAEEARQWVVEREQVVASEKAAKAELVSEPNFWGENPPDPAAPPEPEPPQSSASAAFPGPALPSPPVIKKKGARRGPDTGSTG
jgi:hypothetical protein